MFIPISHSFQKIVFIGSVNIAKLPPLKVLKGYVFSAILLQGQMFLHVGAPTSAEYKITR